MKDNLDRQIAEVGYYLSRRGVGRHPPSELNADTWEAAYSKFYKTLGEGKTEKGFKNSLKGARDHFDSHHNHTRRRGWLEDGVPQPLSSLNREVFNDLKRLTDDILWSRIKPYLSDMRAKRVAAKKAKFFSSEFMGTRASRRMTIRETTVIHGRVVEHLKRYVENIVKNAVVYNTRQIDLALDVDDELQHVYEVKTATDKQSIYTAVGQLFMHSAGALDVEKWIVLPGPIQNKELIECLQTLGISALWYRRRGSSYRFYPYTPA